MKAILKFKPLFIVLAFMTIAMSSINATGITYIVKTDGVFDYELSDMPCVMCGSMTWWEAFDQFGNKYHGICKTCLHQEFE